MAALDELRETYEQLEDPAFTAELGDLEHM